MTAYYLRDEGYAFKKIYHSRKWVGRVYQRADGQWVGQIGRTSSRLEAVRSTAEAAFEQVAAEAMGYKSASEVRARNRAARMVRRAIRARGDQLLGEVRSGNFDALYNISNPVEMTALVNAFTRDLKRRRS